MLTNKLHIAAFTLLSFAAAACSDSVEHYIADVDAPGFVSVSPQTNIKAGLIPLLSPTTRMYSSLQLTTVKSHLTAHLLSVPT